MLVMMNGVDQPINKKLLLLNYIATVIIIILLFYNFYTFKQYKYFILGIAGIFLMIISSIFECYFCRIVFSFPRAIKIRNFAISIGMMYLGILILILTVTLNKSWNFSLILTIVCQFLYSLISFYAIYLIYKKRPLNHPVEREVEDTPNNEQISSAYNPEVQYDDSIFMPPELNYNSDSQLSTNIADTYSESGRKLTDGLHYPTQSPNIYSIGKEDGTNSLYGIKLTKNSESAQFFGLNSTTGAFSEYELYAQPEQSDSSNPICNPYANTHSENII